MPASVKSRRLYDISEDSFCPKEHSSKFAVAAIVCSSLGLAALGFVIVYRYCAKRRLRASPARYASGGYYSPADKAWVLHGNGSSWFHIELDFSCACEHWTVGLVMRNDRPVDVWRQGTNHVIKQPPKETIGAVRHKLLNAKSPRWNREPRCWYSLRLIQALAVGLFRSLSCR